MRSLALTKTNKLQVHRLTKIVLDTNDSTVYFFHAEGTGCGWPIRQKKWGKAGWGRRLTQKRQAQGRGIVKFDELAKRAVGEVGVTAVFGVPGLHDSLVVHEHTAARKQSQPGRHLWGV